MAFKSQNLSEQKPLKIIIRGLPRETNPDLIKSSLEDLKRNVKSLIQLSSGPKTNRRLLPLFYAQLHKSENFVIVYASLTYKEWRLRLKSTVEETPLLSVTTVRVFTTLPRAALCRLDASNEVATTMLKTALQLHSLALYAVIV